MTRQTKLLFLLGAAGVLWALSRTPAGVQFTDTIMSKIARGIRNNNPGNIRHAKGTTWQGASATQGDAAFVQFTAPEYGIRAIAKVLKSYAGRGLTTIEKIIATWAPPTENDTESYIRAVAKATGKARNAPVTVADYPAIIGAIITHENGTQPYPLETINKGVSLA
jgi:hypothetical protein